MPLLLATVRPRTTHYNVLQTLTFIVFNCYIHRLAPAEVQLHLRACELRTELCIYGCGTQVRSSRMREHVEVCPSRFMSRDGDTTDSFDEDEDEDGDGDAD